MSKREVLVKDVVREIDYILSFGSIYTLKRELERYKEVLENE